MRTSDIITITQAVNYTKKAINNLGETTSHKDLLSTYGRRKVWFNFEDKLWSPRISGQVIEDTENVRYGSRGMKIVYTGEATWAETTFSKTDLKNKLIMVSFYIHNRETVGTLRFSLQINGSWNNTIVWEFTSDSPYFRHFQQGWNNVILHQAHFVSTTGTASIEDFSNVTGFRIQPVSSTEGSYITVDMIWLIDKPNVHKSMFTITFDDGYITDYTEARPAMAKHDFRGVSYIIPSSVGASGKMTLEQLKILYEMGWDIANHTWSHKSAYSTPTNEWIEDMQQGYDWLVQNGFGRSAGHLAYPGGHNNKEVRWAVAKCHKTARLNIASGFRGESIPVANPYQITCYPILGDNNPSVDAVKSRIDTILDRGGWLIFMFHRIVDPPVGDGSVTPGYFTQIIDYLAEKNAKVVTMSEVTQ